MIPKLLARSSVLLRKYVNRPIPVKSILPLLSHSISLTKIITYIESKRTEHEAGINLLSDPLLVTALFLSFGAAYISNKLKDNNAVFSVLSVAQCLSKDGVRLREKFNFIADVVEQAAEAVVYIEILDKRQHFFRQGTVTVSNGSGFIIQSDGLIMTNAHVVVQQIPSDIRVRLTDGRTFTGYLESVDMQSDLATIRIKSDNLPVMKLGKSSDLRAGEWVVAIGSPLTLSNTVTAGVVSASHRPAKQLGIAHSGIDYIQTDASITFGNSGGPLVNLDGEAIGINSIKITAGISFAIPIDYAKEFLERRSRTSVTDSGALKNENGHKKFIGITMVSLRPEFISALHARGLLPLDVSSGILVWKVAEGGPAYRAGLRAGDVMTHLNGKEAVSVQQIYEALDSCKELNIRAMRNGHPMQLVVVPDTS